MTDPVNSDAAVVRKAHLSVWRNVAFRPIPENHPDDCQVCAALDRLVASAGKADAYAESLNDAHEAVDAANAALLTAQLDRTEAISRQSRAEQQTAGHLTALIYQRDRAERAEATITRLRDALETAVVELEYGLQGKPLKEHAKTAVQIGRERLAALAQDAEQESA